MKKIIIIIDLEPLTIQRERIFYIQELINAGFHLEHWDFSSYAHGKHKFSDMVSRDYAIKINGLNELEEKLVMVDPAQSLFIVNRDGHDSAFFELLKKHKCFIIGISLFDTTSIPKLPIWVKYTHIPVKDALTDITTKLKLYLKKADPQIVNPFDIIIRSKHSPEVNYYINHPDYEFYKQIKDLPPIINGPYAVFVDQYFPLHPDFFAMYGGRQFASAQDYQSRLNRFFNDIEKKYNLKVVVAAHPKADYPRNTFDDREIIKYRTGELVKGANFVIMHSSNSLAFALLFNKPVLLLTTKLFRRYFRHKLQVMRVARMCKLPIVCVENYNMSKIEIKPVAPEIAKQYVETFLTSPSIKDDKNAEILGRIFAELSKE